MEENNIQNIEEKKNNLALYIIVIAMKDVYDYSFVQKQLGLPN